MSESPSKSDAARFPDATPPEKLSSLVGDYPGLAIVAGIGLGLLAGALLPRKAGRKLARGTVLLATAASEAGLALSKQALARADEATREGREKIGETAADVARLASDAGRKAADAARDAGEGAQKAAVDASSSARDLGLALARKAVDTMSRLRH